MPSKETYEALYSIAVTWLKKMRESNSLERECEAYFTGVSATPTSIADVFRRFITSAQNAKYRINTIKLESGNEPKTSPLLVIIVSRHSN